MEDNEGLVSAEPIAAYGTNSYADVMYMLHTMPISPEVKEQVGRRLVLEVTGKHLSRVFSRLDHLSLLRENWDGEGALPVSPKVIHNIKDVLTISDDDDWKEWMVGPDTNGSLGLQSRTTDACISVGTEEYSYYAEIDDKEFHASHVKFTPSSLLNIMRKLA